ncbi:dihydroorotate dehydrogenase (quinone), partial [Halobacteriales archaeon SW_12_67_38]
VIGVGGVSSAAGAYRKIRAGASLVQLYTGLVYQGPSIARDINRGLLELLDKDGFDSVKEAVGVDLG